MKTSSDITHLHKELSAAPETALRYERAYFGARELMCYVAWRKAHSEEATSPAAEEYRKLLFAWMTVRDFAYVLQAETDPDTVAVLKSGLLCALERETDAELIAGKQLREKNYKGIAGLTETAIARQIPADCYAYAMSQGQALTNYHLFTGSIPPVFWPFHPNNTDYSKWVDSLDLYSRNHLRQTIWRYNHER